MKLSMTTKLRYNRRMKLVEVTDKAQWDSYVGSARHGHPLQLWGWGQAKEGNGWSAHRLAYVDDSKWLGVAQILMWNIPRTRRYIAYVPRGPVVDPGSEAARKMLAELAEWARLQKAIYLRVEPAWTKGSFGKGWARARNSLQMFQTYTIDLERSEDELFAAMGRKHRQYIRQADRNGVSISVATEGDIDSIYQVYEDTAQRAGFGLHGIDYYRNLLGSLGSYNYVYVARFEDKIVAFLWLAGAGATAYELYGGMDTVAGKVHANYLLKWRAITDMKKAGYAVYDFNGRVTAGVAGFKAGFGPTETDYVGTYDYPLNRAGYVAWERLWPLAKPLGRLIRSRRKKGASS